MTWDRGDLAAGIVFIRADLVKHDSGEHLLQYAST
jgi:hypothetical protein